MVSNFNSLPGAILIGFLCISSCRGPNETDRVTTGTLLEEMLDLHRLSFIGGEDYITRQYSSYDRTSVSPAHPGWFANSDGFGGEPVPGFEEVLQPPGPDGTGTYLICDVRGPGAILRLWSAAINGKIRLFLDNAKKPVFEGDAREFFWNTVNVLSDTSRPGNDVKAFRQRDAVYFPIPFARRCRIEWTGNLKDIHFYHVTVRIYGMGIPVSTFKPGDVLTWSDRIREINRRFAGQDYGMNTPPRGSAKLESLVPGKSVKQVFEARGPAAIDGLYMKLHGGDTEKALRACVLRIYFDGASVPQVESPLGDFFGSAPGINPYNSLAFTVLEDSSMVCRFVMPFKRDVRIEAENHSDEDIVLTGSIHQSAYHWIEGSSMHFGAVWQVDHGLRASDSSVFDVPFFIGIGKGRIVGTAVFIYNPSAVVSSWGNWWGEGDEKIFVDRDTFPSTFGTGTEDYFNYSWSSERLFSHAYCGQSRNDGPGNRGYISDFRWHVLDDIPFSEKCAFSMELLHHGVVDGFSYGRMVYFYAIPGILHDGRRISPEDVSRIPYVDWEPEAYLGSAGFSFFDAEDLLQDKAGTFLKSGRMWAGNRILMWKPQRLGQSILFRFVSPTDTLRTNIGLTLAHLTGGGDISVRLNGKDLKFDGGGIISTERADNPVLQNHFSESIRFAKGINEIAVESRNHIPGRKVGIDFIWLKGCSAD